MREPDFRARIRSLVNMGFFTGKDLLWSQLALLNSVDIYEAEAKVEIQEFVLTSVVRKELGEFAEFMFQLQQPQAYAKWKDKQAEEAEEQAEEEAGDYEYVELDEMEPGTFDEVVRRLNKMPRDEEDHGDVDLMLLDSGDFNNPYPPGRL